MRKLSIFMAFLLLLTGCGQKNEQVDTAMKDQVEPVMEVIEETKSFPFYYEKEYELSLYEPKEGVYLGAYVLANQNLGFDMNEFDAITGRSHSSYIYNMKLGDAFPDQWVLECISSMKTPHIIVYPPNDYRPYQSGLLQDLAKSCGEFYVPMLIQFYPNPSQETMAPESYKAFYQEARTIFQSYASNAAFVWAVNINNASQSDAFYPGDLYVDWVGINIFLPVYEQGEKNSRYIWKDFDYIYYQYQDKKPLMISQLAVSHFSTYDHTYYNINAAEAISDIYTRVADNYPRLKAVYYLDFNNIDLSPESAVRDDFSVTNEETVKKAYQEAIQSAYFLSDLQIQNSYDHVQELFVSPFSCIEKDGAFYISENTCLYELDLDLSGSGYAARINGDTYYPLQDVAAIMQQDFYFDEENNSVYLCINGKGK